LSVAPDASRILWIACPSLSSSTTIGSTTRLVLNRTSSIACRFAGSETATKSRLPRFASGSTRRVCDIFASKSSFGNWSKSNDERSSSGTPNARAPKTATWPADRRLLVSTCSTNVTPADWAWFCSDSASDSGMTPCCASARARPERLRVAACVAIGRWAGGGRPRGAIPRRIVSRSNVRAAEAASKPPRHLIPNA